MARTKGVAIVDGNTVQYVDGNQLTSIFRVEGKRFGGESTADTARTAATAHNTANAIDELGLDGDVAIGPALVRFISEMLACDKIDEIEGGGATSIDRIRETKTFMQAIKKGENNE